MTSIFRFLRTIPSEESYINSLFISAFIKLNGFTSSMSDFLTSYRMVDSDSLNKFIGVLNQETDSFNLEKLVKLFEFVISPSDRIINGAIYTPKSIRSLIIAQCLDRLTVEQLYNAKVCDISCGCGGFLMDVAEYIHIKTGKNYELIFKENIYGIDIQEYSVERTKILLSLLALTYGENKDYNFNVLRADTLDFRTDKWNQEYSSFDIIVGNPPYVCSRNVNDDTKAKMLKYEVSHSGHPDLYIPFFQIADEMLKDKGMLGYITMNTFIRSVNGRNLRKYFSSNKKDICIVDFRGYQVFDKKSTYTCLFFMSKGTKSDTISYWANENGILIRPFSYTLVPYSSLNDLKGWNLNDNHEVERIEALGTPIGKYCASRHGIATLSNKTYIFRPIDEDDEYYYLLADNVKYPIEKVICKRIVNSNKLNSNVDFDDIIEQVIYPYLRNEDGTITIIKEDIMKRQYPKAYLYLYNKKPVLAARDKGRTENYPTWYAYGRTQSLQLPRYKLFFPKFANGPIRCVLKDAPDLLLYNGIAFVSNSRQKLMIVQKIIESNIFWQYIVKNAKPYSSNYYSLSGVDIKNFGVPSFSKKEIETLISIKERNNIDTWLSNFYKRNEI